MTETTCRHCGKTFTVKHGTKGLFCSRPCHRAFRVARSPRIPAEQRFWSLVDKGDGDGCWLWTGGTDRRGYGKMFVESGKPVVSAHRFSYMMANGAITSDEHVLHRCDTPRCVRPTCLFLGDAADNARDCSEKDRTAFGVRSHRAVLDDDKAREILRRRNAGENLAAIASDFGVTKGAVYAIAMGRTWRRATGL